MSRAGRRRAGVWSVVCSAAWSAGAGLGLGGASASAQTSGAAHAEERLVAYLSDRGLDELLAAHYRERIAEAAPVDRMRYAEALGKMYSRQLARVTGAAERQELEERAKELLRLVPEAESYELRIDLAKAQYVQAEEVVERDRLRLASPEEKAEAERVLRQVGPAFKELASKVQRRLEQLERLSQAGRDDKTAEIDRELADAKRLRSLARYYAGWSDYYLAASTRSGELARSAIDSFGWILNANEGRAPTLDRLPKSLLQYDHVARATVGVALALAARGQDEEALRWLDAVENAEKLPDSVRNTLFLRRAQVLASGERWTELEGLVRRRREAGGSGPLPTLEARLVAVAALEGLGAAKGEGRAALDAMASLGMADLIARGEVQHVLDLVRRYGASKLGTDGFIAQYVRGLQLYEQARAEHKASGGENEPASDQALVIKYQEAATLLGQSIDAADAASYAPSRSRAGMLRGLSLFYAGKFEDASAAFERSAEGATGEARREAVWLAITTLDRAVEAGRRGRAADRDRLAVLHLREWPTSENSARLLLRRSGAGLLKNDEAAEILLAVPEGSASRPAARRQAARLLYEAYRRAPAQDRDFAAQKFAAVAEEVLSAEIARATEPPADDADKAAKQEVGRGVQVLARQVADAMLSIATPDPARAEAALLAIERVSLTLGLPTDDFKAELIFRRMQLSLARGDEPGAMAHFEALRGEGGDPVRVAERLLYRRAVDAWQRSSLGATGHSALSASVVRFGLMVLDQYQARGEDGEAAAAGVRAVVAEAAAELWRGGRDESMRDLAFSLDEAALKAGPSEAVLRRFAEMAEAKSLTDRAMEAWRTLSSGVDAGSSAWFEARSQLIRLLAAIDPARAREALDQVKVLHPSLGPEPWNQRLGELDRTLPPASAPAPPAADAPSPHGGGG